jgi:D-glycero-D-manno-heptose 1,7-bisphosphate phosphatase
MTLLRAIPVLWLDLDGTVRCNRHDPDGFVNTADDVMVYPEVPDLLRRYRAAGWRIAGVTNQGGIALGLVSERDVMEAIMRTQELSGAAFDKIGWCPHHPGATDPTVAVCWCRKPRIGMIATLAYDLHQDHPDERYPPSMGLLVGNADSDRLAAENAALPFMWADEWRAGGDDPGPPANPHGYAEIPEE